MSLSTNQQSSSNRIGVLSAVDHKGLAERACNFLSIHPARAKGEEVKESKSSMIVAILFLIAANVEKNKGFSIVWTCFFVLWMVAASVQSWREMR